jgi:hypothetical protein
MRSALRVLFLALIVWGLCPAAPHGQSPAPGSLSQAAWREGARLAAADGPFAAPGPLARQDSKDALSNWFRVAALNPGSEIDLTRVGAARSRHRQLAADETGLTILNVDDRTIPGSVKAALERAARDHPDTFRLARNSMQVLPNGHVRLGPDGVFQQDDRLFDLAHIVETVPRDEVVEVGVIAKHVGEHVRRGALIGAVAGGLLVAISAASCGGSGECYNPAGMAVTGAVAGAAVGVEFGAIVGLIAPRSPDLIYQRKPPASR